jgi:hypothetical protein
MTIHHDPCTGFVDSDRAMRFVVFKRFCFVKIDHIGVFNSVAQRLHVGITHRKHLSVLGLARKRWLCDAPTGGH